MEKRNKVRISCSNCLYSKISLIHESDPLKTRHIITESCNKCCVESDGHIVYLDYEGDKLKTKIKK